MTGRDYILDASAVLALLFAEPGAKRVAELADLSFMTGITDTFRIVWRRSVDNIWHVWVHPACCANLSPERLPAQYNFATPKASPSERRDSVAPSFVYATSG